MSKTSLLFFLVYFPLDMNNEKREKNTDTRISQKMYLITLIMALDMVFLLPVLPSMIGRSFREIRKIILSTFFILFANFGLLSICRIWNL